MTRTLPALGIILLYSFTASAWAQQQTSQPPPVANPGAVQKPAAPPQKPGAPATPATQQAPASPQKPGQGQSDAVGRIKADTSLVLVPVSVKDAEGRLVGDLQRDDFRVFQDGVEQQLAQFSSDPFPLSAVVVIDDDLSQKQAAQVQKSLTAIAAGFAPADEVAIVIYDEFPKTVSEFSFNNDLVFTQLKRLELSSHYPGGQGGPMTAGPMINNQSVQTGVPSNVGAPIAVAEKCLDDALYSGGEMLKGRGRDRRKIIFLISDGSNSRRNQHTFKQTLQLLLTSDVSVYSISVGHAFLQHETTRLEKYAGGTGGDTFYAGNALDLGRLYSRVTEQARNQYILAFVPQKTDRTTDYHTIEVRVRRPDLDILAREGYYTSAVNAAH